MSRTYFLFVLAGFLFTSSVSGVDVLCKAETAALIAEMKASGHPIMLTSDSLTLAHQSAMTMCERLLHRDEPAYSQVAGKKSENKIEQKKFFDLFFGSSQRNKGHNRISKIKK